MSHRYALWQQFMRCEQKIKIEGDEDKTNIKGGHRDCKILILDGARGDCASSCS